MTITILQGLPASGKSTKAAQLLKERGNVIRLNKDLLRTMLHFDRWTGRLEGMTRDAERILAKHFLDAGQNVLIDDTNLNPGVLQSWKDLGNELGAKVEVIKVGTSIDECITRDWKREKRVGDHVIIGMAMQNGIYHEPENGIVICDLDGTLADIRHRKHFVEQTPKDWKNFFAGIAADDLRMDVMDRVMAHENAGREVFLVSGRPDDTREVTEAWLEAKANGYRFYRTLFMRRAGDHRPDTDVKREIYDRYFKGRKIVDVIDDRPRLVCMWRDLGLPVTDVGSNEDFRDEREALNYWTEDRAA